MRPVADHHDPSVITAGMVPLTDAAWGLVFAAWLVAVVATLGALFVGEVMGQAPCHLCWYQRAFMFPLVAVLGVGALRADRHVVGYALPLAAAGIVMAGYHVLLYAGIIAEPLAPCSATGPSCTDAAMTVLGGLPLPGLSLAAFGGIAALLVLSRRCV